MDTQNRRLIRIVAGVLALGMIILAVAAPPAHARPWTGAARQAPSQPAPSQAGALNGTYLGVVKLKWAMPGVYSDPLPPPTPDPGGGELPDLGEIDLGLVLSQTGSTVSGYVDLAFCLVFTGEHSIDGQLFGRLS